MKKPGGMDGVASCARRKANQLCEPCPTELPASLDRAGIDSGDGIASPPRRERRVPGLVL